MNHDESSQLLISTIQQILIQDWDPIGIGEIDCMQDEYDGYIGGVLNTLNNDDAKIEDVLNYLNHIEIDYMELQPDLSRNQRVAEKVWQAFEEFLARL